MITFSIFQVIIAVRITDLVVGKISYETKMRMQTFHEISLRHWIIFTNFPEKGWKLSSVKAICLSFFISLLSLCSTLTLFFSVGNV